MSFLVLQCFAFGCRETPRKKCPGPEVGPLQQHALKSRGGSETAVRGCHESNDQVSHTHTYIYTNTHIHIHIYI